MKIYLLLLIALVLSCQETSKQATTSVEKYSAVQKEKKVVATNGGLDQNGDYSSLFNRADCKVITAEEMSLALGTTFTDESTGRLCNFRSQMGDKSWILNILYNKMSKKSMLKEIKNFQTHEAGFLTHKVSDTGDTHLCNQHSHGYLSIYNPNYDGMILIRYGSVASGQGFTKEDRLVQQDLALKLANTLLKKHKK